MNLAKIFNEMTKKWLIIVYERFYLQFSFCSVRGVKDRFLEQDGLVKDTVEDCNTQFGEEDNDSDSNINCEDD